MNQIETVYNENLVGKISLEPRSLNQDIPVIHENIPEKKNIGYYILFAIIFIYIFINSIFYYDMYNKLYTIENTIDMVKTEQLNRTARVYTNYNDKLCKEVFQEWLVEFENQNPELFVPPIPKCDCGIQ